MESPKQNNPASRLYRILERLKQIPGTNPCAPSFAAILEVPSNDQMQLIERIAGLTALMRRAREQALAINASQDYLEWFEPVRIAFLNLNLWINLGAFTEKISPVVLERLRFCAIKLSEYSGEPELAKAEAAHVLQEINAMIKETTESQMPEGVRQYMLRHLVRIANALRDYELFGVEPIRDYVSGAIGSPLLQHEEARAAGSRFWEVVFKVGELVQTGAAAIYIGGQFTQLLLK